MTNPYYYQGDLLREARKQPPLLKGTGERYVELKTKRMIRLPQQDRCTCCGLGFTTDEVLDASKGAHPASEMVAGWATAPPTITQAPFSINY